MGTCWEHHGDDSINQAIYLSKKAIHWAAHQGRMQPPLSDARKTVSVKATNDNNPRRNLVNRKMFRSNIYDQLYSSTTVVEKRNVGLYHRKKISIRCTAAQRSQLLQYLQNRFSTQLYRDKNLSCFFLIKQLGSSTPK